MLWCACVCVCLEGEGTQTLKMPQSPLQAAVPLTLPVQLLPLPCGDWATNRAPNTELRARPECLHTCSASHVCMVCVVCSYLCIICCIVLTTFITNPTVSQKQSVCPLCSVLIDMFQEAPGQAQMSEPGYCRASTGYSTTENNACDAHPPINFYFFIGSAPLLRFNWACPPNVKAINDSWSVRPFRCVCRRNNGIKSLINNTTVQMRSSGGGGPKPPRLQTPLDNRDTGTMSFPKVELKCSETSTALTWIWDRSANSQHLGFKIESYPSKNIQVRAKCIKTIW